MTVSLCPNLEAVTFPDIASESKKATVTAALLASCRFGFEGIPNQQTCTVDFVRTLDDSKWLCRVVAEIFPLLPLSPSLRPP
jgi:hypothetical protein